MDSLSKKDWDSMASRVTKDLNFKEIETQPQLVKAIRKLFLGDDRSKHLVKQKNFRFILDNLIPRLQDVGDIKEEVDKLQKKLNIDFEDVVNGTENNNK